MSFASGATASWLGPTGASWSNNAAFNPSGSPSGKDIVFTDTGGASGTTVTSTVDTSFTINSLNFAQDNTVNQTLSIASGQTLGVTGGFTPATVNSGVGSLTAVLFDGPDASATANTTKITGGAGSLAVNSSSANFLVGYLSGSASNGVLTTVDMSGLGTFTANVNIFGVGRKGDSNLDTTNRNQAGVLTLAINSTITANELSVGDSNGIDSVTTSTENSSTSGSVLNLAAGGSRTNTLDVDRVSVGIGRQNTGGGIDFGSGVASTDTATFRGKNGTGAVGTFTVGEKNSTSGSNDVGTVNFGAGQADLLVSNMYIGHVTVSSSGGYTNGTLSLGTNTASQATVTNLNLATLDSVTGIGGTTVNAGTLIVNAGTFTATTANLASLGAGNSGTYSGGFGHAANLLVGGGTFRFGSINGPDTNSNGSATINFSSGTLSSSSSVAATIASGINIKLGTSGGSTLNWGQATGGTGAITVNSASVLQGNTTFNTLADATFGGGLSGGFGITKAGAKTLLLGGSSTYSGATTVNLGQFGLSGGTLTASAVTVGNATISPGVSGNGTFLVSGNSVINGTASVTLTAGDGVNIGAGNISLVDTTINSLLIHPVSGTGLTLGGGNNLSFDTGSTSADQIAVDASQVVVAAGTNTVNVNLLGRPTTNQLFTLVSAPGGGLTAGGATYSLGTISGVSDFGIGFSLSSTDTAIQLAENVIAAPGTAYFRGNLGASWAATSGSNTNFTNDSAGNTAGTQLPGATTDVHFYAQNATTANVGTSTLDGATTIKSLTVDGAALGESAAVGIYSGTGGTASTLTITPSSSATGLTVGTGAGTVTIAAPVIFGASQTITNNSSNSLVLSGGISDGGSAETITSAGSGVVTVSAAANGIVNGTTINLSGGTLNSNNATALGTLATVNVGDGATLALGATQTIAALNNPGTVSNSGVVALGSNSLTIGGSANLSSSFTGSITGLGGITKAGTGMLVFGGANSYSGGTNIQAGTLQVNIGGTLGSSTGSVSIGTGVAGTLGTVGNLTINTNTSIGTFNIVSNTSDTTTASNKNQLNISSASTLTVGGPFTVGLADTSGNATNTALGTGAAGSGGTLTVNNSVALDVSGSSGSSTTPETAVVDLSGLSNFNQIATSGALSLATQQRAAATLTLATSNLINVGSIDIGDSNGSNPQGSVIGATLNLGTGTNALEAPVINIGAGTSNHGATGVIQFASPALGSVTITGANGSGSAAINIGVYGSSGSVGVGTSSLLLAGHTANVTASTVTVGSRTGTSTYNSPIANLTFDTGTFNAGAIQLAVDTQGNAGGGNVSTTGAFTVGTNSSSTGVVNVSGNIVLAANTNPDSVASGSLSIGPAIGTLTINGGTVNANTLGSTIGGIFDTSTNTAIGSNTTLTLAGGTLDLHGGVIGGSPTGSVGKKLITTLNFLSGTLQNVAEINGGAPLIKTGANALTLAGSNGYTGGTTVSAGTLFVNNSAGSGTGSGSVNLNAGTLGGTGSLTGDINAAATSSVTPGSGTTVGTLTTGNVNFAANSTLSINLNSDTASASLLNSNNVVSLGGVALLSVFDLSTTTGGSALAQSTVLPIITATGGVSGQFSGLTEGSPVTVTNGGNNVYTIDYQSNAVDLVVASPEPGSLSVLALGALSLMRRRRRRVEGSFEMRAWEQH